MNNVYIKQASHDVNGIGRRKQRQNLITRRQRTEKRLQRSWCRAGCYSFHYHSHGQNINQLCYLKGRAKLVWRLLRHTTESAGTTFELSRLIHFLPLARSP